MLAATGLKRIHLLFRGHAVAILITLCTLTSAVGVSVVFGAGSPPVLVYSLDKRSDKADRDYYGITFSYRKGGSIFGHALVSWFYRPATRADDQNENQMIGFYPSPLFLRTKVATGTAGQLEDDAAGLIKHRDVESISEILIVRVDRATYEATLSQGKLWVNKRYELLSSDCVSYLASIVRQIGIAEPTRFLSPTPSLYVQGLIESNAFQY
ncbi:hypothetical protein ACFPT7_07240 [Acidicapsa dinghuensis]|uniref:DUF4105 domain-containing protein n=1 Tax=Acidicapsa dinghuensis TaxID=2218256 RepID=A0ABW1EE25_9BACT|nr:hypothetical protein [Acidicapsa dinghuensis]